GGNLDFGEKPFGAEHGREFGPQHFEGDFAIMLEIGRQVHGCHATGAQRALDPVALGERGGERGDGGGHGWKDAAEGGWSRESGESGVGSRESGVEGPASRLSTPDCRLSTPDS